MSAMRTIKVTGKGKSRVTPDAIRLTLNMEETYPEYQETLRHSVQDTAKQRELLMQLGFKGTDLKTPYFYLDTKYEQVQVLGSYERQFAVYQYNHEMKVEFPLSSIRYFRRQCFLLAR
ncbi:SIMPL domain-containing protein [Eubacterium sp. F2]|uniref:SIMPL domain-containing protein n=1 Tax=Eubacterium sp. F2 TaxID=3381348 RepID=UPI0039082A55